jgi:hypothetical protein
MSKYVPYFLAAAVGVGYMGYKFQDARTPELAMKCLSAELNAGTGNKNYINRCAAPVNFEVCRSINFGILGKAFGKEPEWKCHTGKAQPNRIIDSLFQGSTFGEDKAIKVNVCYEPHVPVTISQTKFQCIKR